MSQYTQSSQTQSVDLSKASWNGAYEFLDVYACQFPESSKVQRRITAMFNDDSIHLTRVDYPNSFSIFVISSIRPDGQSLEDEIQAQEIRQENLLNSHGSSVVEFGMQKTMFPFGKGAFMDLMNPTVDGEAFFPFELGFYGNEKTLTMSSHLTFPLGDSRIEIVALGIAPEHAAVDWGSTTKAKLKNLVFA